ncbi:MAG: hypothetical protein FJ213_04420 [Ignavibacteria bacterium]|nr:hypothetical protein [Ignavibacteria bacterium]
MKELNLIKHNVVSRISMRSTKRHYQRYKIIHICIRVTAYPVYKEFERVLEKNQFCISVEKSIEEIKQYSNYKYASQIKAH